MKGIILAGGKGTRLYPLTRVINKHLLPIYDKPMIYYPLTTLMLAGVREFLIVSSSADLPRFVELLGDGADWGVRFEYAEQPRPGGLPQAFQIGAGFIGTDPVWLILGDNVFYSHGLASRLQAIGARERGATVFTTPVRDPQRYGVLRFDADRRPVEIVEKPQNPPSNLAVVGLYRFDNRVVDIARGLTPSRRGELEISDVINAYIAAGELSAEPLGRGCAWFDAGTPASMAQASGFIEVLESRQNVRIACPEEAAFRMGFIDAAQVRRLAQPFAESDYGRYLLDVAAAQT